MRSFFLMFACAGCVTQLPISSLCGVVHEPVARDAQSSLGFSPDEMIAELVDERSRWVVDWTTPEGADPVVLTVHVTSVGATDLVRFEPPSDAPDVTCPGDELVAALEIEVTSTDGQVVSQGPATLVASSLGGPFVGLTWDHEPELGAEPLARVQEIVPDGATLTGVQFWSDQGALGIRASWEGDPTGSGTAFACTYDVARAAEARDCIEMTAP